MAKAKKLSRVKLTGKEPVLRFIELHVMIEIHLFNMHDAGDIIITHVRQKTATLDDFFYSDLVAVLSINQIAHCEAHPCQGSVVRSVDSPIPCGYEKDGDPVALEGEHDAKTQFGFRFTDPSLTGYKIRQTELLMRLTMDTFRIINRRQRGRRTSSLDFNPHMQFNDLLVGDSKEVRGGRCVTEHEDEQFLTPKGHPRVFTSHGLKTADKVGNVFRIMGQ